MANESNLSGQDKAESKAVQQYLLNYVVTDVGRNIPGEPADLTTDNQIAKRNSGGGKKNTHRVKIWPLLLALALAIMGIAVYVFRAVSPDAEISPKEQINKDIAMLQTCVQAAIDANGSFNYMKWASTNEALESFALFLASCLPEQVEINYRQGNSYISFGTDPWGEPYYITAKRLGTSDNEKSAYDFYITSSGENSAFDTEKLILDKDDVANVLYSMANYAFLGGEHSIVTGDDSEGNSAMVKESVPLTFDNAGGTGGASFAVAEYGKLLPTVEVPNRNGYVFRGYFDEANGGGVQYFDKNGDGCHISRFQEGVTFYAAWDEQIVQDLEGGSGLESGEGEFMTDEYDHSLEEPSAGQEQQEPPEDSSGEQESGKVHQQLNESGATENINGDTIHYTVHHYVMDESGNYPTKPTKSYSYETVAGTELNLRSRAVNTMLENGNTVLSECRLNGKTTNAGVISDRSTISLYYSRKKATIQVATTEGITVRGAGEYYAGTSVTLKADVAPGFTFTGWSGDFTEITETLTFTVPAAGVTLVASAEAAGPMYTVFFEPLGGQLSMEKKSVQGNGCIGALPTPQYPGYDFCGWYTAKEGGSRVGADTEYFFGKDITVYAQWTPATAIAMFDMQGGEHGTEQITVAYGEQLPKILPPVRDGFTFCGYYSEPEGNGIQVYNSNGEGERCWFFGQKTYYACWNLLS